MLMAQQIGKQLLDGDAPDIPVQALLEGGAAGMRHLNFLNGFRRGSGFLQNCWC